MPIYENRQPFLSNSSSSIYMYQIEKSLGNPQGKVINKVLKLIIIYQKKDKQILFNMGTKHCFHSQCSSDNRKFKKDPKNKIFFIPFPKPHIDPAKWRQWIIAYKRANFDETKIKPHTYIYSKHFIGENGPTVFNPDPVSATQSKVKYYFVYFSNIFFVMVMWYILGCK